MGHPLRAHDGVILVLFSSTETKTVQANRPTQRLPFIGSVVAAGAGESGGSHQRVTGRGAAADVTAVLAMRIYATAGSVRTVAES
jgi:hypothetical protein